MIPGLGKSPGEGKGYPLQYSGLENSMVSTVHEVAELDTTEPLSLSLFVTLMVIKTIPKKKRCKKAKWLSEEALEIADKRREDTSKGEKERHTHLNAEFQRIARRDKKVFISDQCKEIEENNRMGKTRDLFKKIRDTKGTFHAKMGSIKDIALLTWLIMQCSRSYHVLVT